MSQRNQRTISLKSLQNSALAISTSIALVLTFTAIVVYDYLTFGQNIENKLTILAKVTANNSQGAVSFDDEDTAKDILYALRVYEHIWYASISSVDNRILAEYRKNNTFEIAPRVIESGSQVKNGFIEISQPISWEGKVIGHVFLLADLQELAQRRTRILIIGSTVLLFALAVSFLTSIVLTRRLTSPIFSLAELAKNVSRDKDYSSRAEQSSVSEINTLVMGFNDMLEEIHHRDLQLVFSEERLSLALKGGEEGMWDWSLAEKSVYFDSQSCQILGFDAEEMVLSLQEWKRLIYYEDRLKVKQYIRSFFRDSLTDVDLEYRVLKSKTKIWLKLKGKVVGLNDGKPVRITGTLRDITFQRESEEKIKLFATVFNNTSDAVVILDPSFSVIAINQAFSNITQYTSQDMIGSDNIFLRCKKNRDKFKERLLAEIQKNGHWRGEVWDVRKSGESYPIELELNSVYHKQEELTHYVAVFSDITERKRTEEELYFMANYDPLTNLPNRSMFHDRLKKALSKAKRSEDLLAVLFIDLDKFKHVNDSFGHEVGDELLKQVAHRTRETVRESDTIFRLSGDEFTIIIESLDDIRIAEVVAKNVQKAFHKDFYINGQNLSVGVSIGISIYPNDAKDSETLLKNADRAMYSIKAKGRNSYCFFDKEMNSKAERRSLIESELKKAIEASQIDVYYQPKIDAKDFSIKGFEALARWSHPSLGEISPVEFIPVAEESVMIQQLGQLVLHKACKQLKHWHALGYTWLSIAVNVSAREFQLSDYPLHIVKTLHELKLDPNNIELELTESLVMENPEKTILMLEVLKNLKVTLSIDDFGTGYSSLSYLRKFPIDVLKVDQSFINEIVDSEDGLSLTSAIIAMAHNLNMKVVAEGVENLAQLKELKGLSCELYQGFLFSPPVSSSEAESLLKQQTIKPKSN